MLSKTETSIARVMIWFSVLVLSALSLLLDLLFSGWSNPMSAEAFARGYFVLVVALVVVGLWLWRRSRTSSSSVSIALASGGIVLAVVGLLLSTALGAVFSGPCAIAMGVCSRQFQPRQERRFQARALWGIGIACVAIAVSVAVLVLDLRRVP